MMNQQPEINDGLVAAAMLAGGIGSFFLGLITSLAQGSKALGNLLNFYDPVGPLGGKTLVTIALWLVCWAILSTKWRNQPVNFGKIYRATLILVALGLVGTFPLFFDLLGH
jgi:hypothetical protein